MQSREYTDQNWQDASDEDLQAMIDNVLLDGVNKGSLSLVDGKFKAASQCL